MGKPRIMKTLYLLLLLPIFIYSQDTEPIIDYNWIADGGDVTRLNQVPSNWTIGNPCGVPLYTDVFVQGNLTLKDTCYIQYGRLTIYGDLIDNGFPIIMKCGDDSVLIIEGTLSVPSFESEEVKIWPNPTNGVFHVKSQTPFRVEIYDLHGRLVGRELTLAENPTGLYLVRVYFQGTDKVKTFKLIKK